MFVKRALRPVLLAFALCAATAPLHAGDWGWLGWANLSTNDGTGDGQDRWQSFSASASFLFGPKGSVRAPYRFGPMIEARLGAQIMTPENTSAPAPGDRPMAGALRVGLYTHAARGGWDLTLGAGAEAVGPATRIVALQDRFHAVFGFDRVAAPVIAGQIGNRVRPMANAQAAYRLKLDDHVTLRPFGEVYTGLETFARVGFDLLVGPGYQNGVMARDYVTGQLYNPMKRVNDPGVSVAFGADVARVFSSAYLPAPAYRLTPLRARLRGGVLIEDRLFGLFYGATYLTPEFGAQTGGQALGSVQLQLKF